MDRKSFLQILGGGLVTLPILSVIGCGSDDGAPAPIPEPTPTENCDNGAIGTIASNHGHSLAVPVADVQAGVEKTYTIQGTSGHDHTITVTVANFTNLSNGQAFEITSTAGGGHTHIVTVFCA